MTRLLKITRPYKKGDDVRAVQEALVAQGFNPGEIDGIYGPKTAAAVTAFQKASDIKVDGIVGPQTWNVLCNWPETEHFNRRSFVMEKLLKVTRPYMKGDDVSAVQRVLDNLGFDTGNIDGIYGPITSSAVEEFQKKNNLLVDGIVGPQTWNTLFNWPETEHFKLYEFKCKDGTEVPYEYYENLKKLTALLEVIRSACGDKPLIITSGYRTPSYNEKVGGAAKSQHLYAAAADVRTPEGMDYEDFYKICDELNPDGGVGYYKNRFVHVDVRGKRARW